MTFETTLSYNEEEFEVEITYEARPGYVETRYLARRAFEVQVTETVYKQNGVIAHIEGNLWQRLEWLAQEAAEEHFSESGAAA